MKKKGSTFLLVITVMLFSVAMTMAGLTLYMNQKGYVIADKEQIENSIKPQEEFNKLIRISELIEEHYPGEYHKDKAIEEACRSLVQSLGDPYSRYLNEEELKQLQDGISNSYSGTGIVFIEDEESDGFLITEVLTGGPAENAGVEAGDVIVQVDGKTPKDTEEAISMLKGDPGTEVKIRVKRGDANKDFSLVRGEIPGEVIETTTFKEENLGYIRIKIFGEDTDAKFDEAVSGFEAAKVDGIIIDIRDNPGGLMEKGIEIADKLLPEGLIVYTVDAKGERTDYNSDSKCTRLPFVILVNENTASAGEMLAAAVKTFDAGTLIGAKTYGKGRAQMTTVFEDNSALNLTISEFFAPDGTKIDGVGVNPDILVRNPAAAKNDPQLERAKKELAKK